MEKFLELHKSPDGLLEFGVSVADDGDLTIGFVANSSPVSFYGHTHGDLLQAELQLPTEQAIANYVQSVLASEKVIVVIRIDGHIANVYISDEPDSAVDYLQEDEKLELRYWNGIQMANPI